MKTKHKVGFITESQFLGKYPRNFLNSRTDVAWMIALDAEHFCIYRKDYPTELMDIGIFILPKNIQTPLLNNEWLTHYKKFFKKIAVMQEGPNWYWQDYEIEKQIWFYNVLQEMDFILTHNPSDKNYYRGLTCKPTYVMQSLMILDTVENIEQVSRKNIILSGNFTSWYNAFDGFIVANELKSCNIFVPSSGRRVNNEQLLGVQHLPWMNWTEWIQNLNTFKYGINLMRTRAAGTFSLNCAYLGIPCIGYKTSLTQEICFPGLSVEVGDLNSAKVLLRALEDEDYYEGMSNLAKKNYEFFSEKAFIDNMNIIFNDILDEKK